MKIRCTRLKRKELRKISEGGVHLDDPRWTLAQKVADSETFRRANRLREFLLYICRCALDEDTEAVSERQIGIHVFGRAPGYDSSDDNVVRSQARLLRMKLESYFANEGQSESGIIVVPKGAYLPEFKPRVGLKPSFNDVQTAQSGPRRLAGAAILLAAVLACVCVWLAVALRASRRSGEETDLKSPFALFWARIFQPDQQTLIVASDHTHLLAEDLARRAIPLSEYLSPDYAQRVRAIIAGAGPNPTVWEMAGVNLTAMYAVRAVALIASVAPGVGRRLEVRSARDVTMSDFENANAILLAGRPADPWIELFDRDLNFRYERRFGESGTYCVNRHPRPGELAAYSPTNSGTAGTVYAGVAFVPGLNHRGNVLIISGTSGGGAAELATEFITNQALASPILTRLLAESGGRQMPSFELLLRGVTINREPSHPELLAYRIIR